MNPAAARADDAGLSLSDLESRLVASPALAAADTKIFSADEEVSYESSRGSGFNYYFANDFGPRSDIITGQNTDRTIRYGQLFGVEFPLFGTRLTEHLALSEARSQANLARIEAEGERRSLLARLRDSYIKFWQYDREQSLIANYVALEKAEAPSARTFLREGFWTQANYLGFIDGVTQLTTDLSAVRAQRRSALADLRGILNSDIPDRTPQPPDMQLSCAPSVEQAVSVAAENDPEIARLEEEQSEARSSLDFIKHSTISASFRVGAGTDFDIPQHAVGYNVTGSFAVAFPQHGRSEEYAKREAAYGDIQQYHFLEVQRRSELRAAVLNVLDQASAAGDEYAQARRVEVASREQLREARVREATLISTGASSFNEVQMRILDAYNADRSEATTLGATYIGVNAIEKLVPDTCVPFRLDGVYVRR